MHHLDSWINIDQLDVTCFIISLFVLNMLRMLVHPSSGACDLLWIYFVCCIALVRCVLQYNTWNKSTISRELLKMNILTFEKYWAANSEIIKQVTSRWSIFIQQTPNCLKLYLQRTYSVYIFLTLSVSHTDKHFRGVIHETEVSSSWTWHFIHELTFLK